MAFVVLFAAAQLVVPAPPSVTAPGVKVVEYYQAHAVGVRLAAWLGILSGAPLVVFICWLRSRLAGIGRDVTLLAGAALFSLSAVWMWFSAVADVAAYYGPLLTVTAVLLAAPVAIAAWQPAGMFPRWVGWFTVLFVSEQIAETSTVFATRGFFAPGGGMNFFVGAPLFLVWVVVVAAGGRRDQ